MSVWYTTRETVMRAADIKASAYVTADVDRAIESGARDVDRLLGLGDANRPGLAPWYGALTFDRPVLNNESNFRFWLKRHRLIRLDAVVSGGTDITTSVLPWPSESGPPYSAIDVDRSTDASFTIESGIGQRSLVAVGLWGQTEQERTNLAWELGSSPSAAATAVTIHAPIGVGAVVRIGDERMIVTERSWLSSGQTGTLAASVNAQALSVSDGTAFFTGETLLMESERLLVQDIAGNTLIVRRQADGSTLAAHTSATIYYGRSCTVERGALGTTADTHTSGAQIYVWQPPTLAEKLNVAYALDGRAQEVSAYARTVGVGDNVRNASGAGLRNLENDVREALGRGPNMAAV